MKTKTKKCGVIAALAAALILSAALVTTCVDSLGPTGLTIAPEKEQKSFVPPPGMGYIELNIIKDESAARTVLPGGSPTIATYSVLLYSTAATPVLIDTKGPFTPGSGTGSITAPIVVQTGTYNIEVQGSNSTSVVVGVGTAAGVEVTTSGTTDGPKAVVLHEVITGTLAGSGTFAWNFTFPTGTNEVNSATMTLSNWGSQSNTIPPALVNVDVKTTTSNAGVAIPSGFYYADVTLMKTGHRTQTYREIVHIANTLTSTWGKNDFANLSRNVYTVTYVTGGGTAPGAVNNVVHNATLTTPTPPEVTGNTFLGWFIDNVTFAREWIFSDHTWGGTPPDPEPDPDRVIKDLTLYASWQDPIVVQNGNLSLTVSFSLTGPQSFEFSQSPTFDLDDIYLEPGPHNIAISLTNTNFAIFDANSVEWTYLTYTLGSGQSINITLDTNAAPWNILTSGGQHDITVTGKVGGVPYSGTLILIMQ